MEPPGEHEVTRLLQEWQGGDRSALDSLTSLVASELRRLAGSYMRNERPGHTLQPTALVNEAWLRLAKDPPRAEGRSHFIAIAANCMRKILVEHARRRNAIKRGLGDTPVSFDDLGVAATERPQSLIALDEGLDSLARVEERPARVVELHYFGGLNYEEIAGLLKIGRSTVVRDLRMAEVWLKDYIAA